MKTVKVRDVFKIFVLSHSLAVMTVLKMEMRPMLIVEVFVHLVAQERLVFDLKTVSVSLVMLVNVFLLNVMI